jgi:hypothetical protein
VKGDNGIEPHPQQAGRKMQSILTVLEKVAIASLCTLKSVVQKGGGVVRVTQMLPHLHPISKLIPGHFI